MDDLWIDDAAEGDDLALLFEDGLLAAEAAAAVVAPEFGGGLIGYVRKKKRDEEDPLRSWEDTLAFKSALGLERIRQERDRQEQIAAVRDLNLQKAQAALAENRNRQKEIEKTRMKNLRKAWRARQ